MCLSRLGQIIYGALAFVTVALIAAAMFTKGKLYQIILINKIVQVGTNSVRTSTKP